jgi:structure-specific recognition protein 1
MQIPRGNYTLDFYSDFAKLHGKTHDYKILFTDISKIFLLQKPDGVHMVYLLQLNQPLRQGMTLHHYVAMNFELEREVKLKLNLTPEELKAKFGSSLQSELEGKLYDVLSSLFNNLVGIKKIIVPGDFKSSRGAKAFNCSVKAAEGYLFPLKSSLVFIHKPVLYVRHSELKHVEFGRTGQGASRTFDLTLTKLKDEPNITFLSIDRDEQQALVSYFKAAGVKMKTVDEGGNKQELKDSPQKKDHEMNDYDDEEGSEDESFNESGKDSEDESAEVEADSDVDMIDEELDGKELRAIQEDQENGGDVDLRGGRSKR